MIEPQSAVCGTKQDDVLNMVSKESIGAQDVSVDLSKENPAVVLKDVNILKCSKLPRHHQIFIEDINLKRLEKILNKTKEIQPVNFEQLLGTEGVGPRTIRALALVADLIYGRPPGNKDPVNFSFAHGGKDGHPFPVDKIRYSESIEVLRKAVKEAKLGYPEKLKILKKISLNPEA